MEITMQSFFGIGHSIDFWRSAENPPPSAEIPKIQGCLCLKSINNVFCIFLLLYMSMGITIQSCLGIVHSVHFWYSAENLPPQWNILPPQQKIIPLSKKSYPLSSKYPPSAENSLPLAKIPEIQGHLCLKSINKVFFHFYFVGHVHVDHHAKFRGNRT